MAFGWLAGMDLDADRLYSHYARYERQSATQAVATSTDTQVQFPTPVSTDPLVVASGASNNAFELGSGAWWVEWGIRVATAAVTWETTLAVGSATWALGNVTAGGAISGLAGGGSGLVTVDAGTTAIVCIGSWQASGGSINIASFGHLTSISFARLDTGA